MKVIKWFLDYADLVGYFILAAVVIFMDLSAGSRIGILSGVAFFLINKAWKSYRAQRQPQQ